MWKLKRLKGGTFTVNSMKSTKNLYLPIFSTGEKMKVGIKKILYNKKSDFQNIMIADSMEFGKCLIIDGIMQCAESDHEMYDAELLKPLKRNNKKIIILGGGDGFVAQMALQKNPNLKIKIVDLDSSVVKSCKKEMGQKIFNDERVSLFMEDVFNYLKTTAGVVNGKFDGIICDLTDAPIGRRKKADFEKFYSDIISLSSKHLGEGGWISIQAGASQTTSHYIDAASIIQKLLKKYFNKVDRSDVFIPSYGEPCAFLFGEK